MTKIVVKLQVEGFHCWKDCNIESEEYLKNKHRHIFYITAKKQVSHDDRDIEIINFKNKIAEYLQKTFGKRCEFENMSCEMIAEHLLEVFKLDFCSVLEDNENGAEVEI